MVRTINQKVVFKGASRGSLYHMFLNSKEHTALTGGQVATISARVGAKFNVWDGYITGKNLQLVHGSLIVQSWRGSD